jgi:ribonuclease HI
MTVAPQVELYCDGACLGNPGPGGWAFLLRIRRPAGHKEKEGRGHEAETTNNRMELTAALKGLQALVGPCRVELVCDSLYVVKGLSSWLPGWKAAGWRKADRGPVLNADLWQALDEQLARHEVVARWVRGHSGHRENERVDKAAREAAARA